MELQACVVPSQKESGIFASPAGEDEEDPDESGIPLYAVYPRTPIVLAGETCCEDIKENNKYCRQASDGLRIWLYHMEIEPI